MTGCARGCVVRRRHTPDCPDRDRCRGCAPRIAEHGLLCATCHDRLRLALVGAPADMDGEPAPGLGQVADWLAAHTPAGSRPRGDEVVIRRTKGTPPVPIDCDVIDLGDEIHDVLRSWCDAVASSDWLDTPDAGLTGPVDTVPETTAAWLWVQHERVESGRAVDVLVTEILDLVSRAHALVPWRRPRRHLLGLPCPHCQLEGLHVHGGDDGASCHACGSFVRQERLALWERMVLAEYGTQGPALAQEGA